MAVWQPQTLRDRPEITARSNLVLRADCIIPFAVEFVVQDVDLRHFLIGYGDAFRVGFGIEFTRYREACLCGGGADQIDDYLIADQRLGPPVPASGSPRRR